MRLSTPPYASIPREQQNWFRELQAAIEAMPQISTLPSGTPNGVLAGYPGDLVTIKTGGAGTTLWVKESGNGSTGGWVSK